jgi:hypothetical protein
MIFLKNNLKLNIMKKILFLITTILLSFSCKEANEKDMIQNSKPISLNDLDSISTKSIFEIKDHLKEKNYLFFSSQKDSEQWKLEGKDDIIQFNGEGILLYMTIDKKASNSIVNQLKDSNYSYTGKSNKDGTDVDSYSKENQTLLISTLINPETNQNVYSFTFLNRTN